MVFVEFNREMPVIICESFHDVHCFKLAKCIPQFCLDLVCVFRSLSPQSHLNFWANKDHVANLEVQRVRNSHFISWSEIHVEKKESEQICCQGRETIALNPTFQIIHLS
jgi:hypothetical protein